MYPKQELPLDELPSFQSFIYENWSPIEVKVEEVNEHVYTRTYYGHCGGCGDEHPLGYLKYVDDVLANFYVFTQVG